MLLMLICIPFQALSECVILAEPLSGTICWPEETDEQTASFLYRYNLPRASGESAMAQGINAFYAYYLEDAIAFTVPILGESLEDLSVPSWCDVQGEVTCNMDTAFSVRMITTSCMDGETTVIWAGHVFASSGPKEGLVISLPYLLGILSEDENDTWLQDRQTQKADRCVRDLIWETLEKDRDAYHFLPDATYDLFCDMFYPEEDFYLDASGNPVFFVQPGILTEEEDGVLLFPLSLETILDEI